jgi:hypothetical protein
VSRLTLRRRAKCCLTSGACWSPSRRRCQRGRCATPTCSAPCHARRSALPPSGRNPARTAPSPHPPTRSHRPVVTPAARPLPWTTSGAWVVFFMASLCFFARAPLRTKKKKRTAGRGNSFSYLTAPRLSPPTPPHRNAMDMASAFGIEVALSLGPDGEVSFCFAEGARQRAGPRTRPAALPIAPPLADHFFADPPRPAGPRLSLAHTRPPLTGHSDVCAVPERHPTLCAGQVRSLFLLLAAGADTRHGAHRPGPG